MTKKFIPTPQMLEDYSQLGDKALSSKYKVSRRLVIKIRKDYQLPKFNNQYGLREHRIESDIEYKWCSSGHWEPINNFYTHSNRWDGLRSVCIDHEKKYPSNNKGRKSWNTRKHNSIRRNAFISWTEDNELRAYELCNKSCAYCKVPINLPEVEFDHFIPVKMGGATEPSNMLPSCHLCNRGRGGKFDKDPYQWLMVKFGAYYGEQIYVECCGILEKLK